MSFYLIVCFTLASVVPFTVSERKQKPVLGLKGECSPDIDFDNWLSASPPAADFELVQAHVFVRHGARTNWASRLCWNKPYSEFVETCTQSVAGVPFVTDSDMSTTNGLHFVVSRVNGTEYRPGNCMTGQLTTLGWHMEYANGNGLHQRYAAASNRSYKVLPSELNSQTVNALNDVFYMRADDSHRVQQSLMGVFSGMYPESQKKRVANGLTLPLWTMDTFYEIMYPNGNVCPQWLGNFVGATLSSQWIHKGMAMKPLLRQLEYVVFGGDLGWTDVPFVFDCANVRICEKWPLPPQIDEPTFEALSTNFTWMYNYINQYPNWRNATRYQVGPLLHFVKRRMEDKLKEDGSNNIRKSTNGAKKVYLYAGHDTGPITPMLGFFKHTMDHWLPYAAMVSIELFKEKTTGRLYVLTSFNGKVIQLPPPCDAQHYGLCSFDAFNKYWADVIPDASECVLLE